MAKRMLGLLTQTGKLRWEWCQPWARSRAGLGTQWFRKLLWYLSRWQVWAQDSGLTWGPGDSGSCPCTWTGDSHGSGLRADVGPGLTESMLYHLSHVRGSFLWIFFTIFTFIYVIVIFEGQERENFSSAGTVSKCQQQPELDTANAKRQELSKSSWFISISLSLANHHESVHHP